MSITGRADRNRNCTDPDFWVPDWNKVGDTKENTRVDFLREEAFFGYCIKEPTENRIETHKYFHYSSSVLKHL
ncbi:unnamed protein product [Cuscuta campestris]|uniref:Uncharacterized protein n=1 Tax=Cuscuta campestris TaxID=132261 RepID=A0A484LIG5_9ASTE|nr:unnamed protein product [Cuscuta campestris]